MLNFVKDSCKAIADHYGLDNQRLIALEELSELQVALLNENRGKGTKEEIATEIADVMIMCRQMSHLYGIGDEVSREINRKLVRQLKRISEEENP